MPVFDFAGSPLAAINVSGPVGAFADERLRTAIGDELRRAGGEAAGEAGGAEHGQPGQQHALAAEPVGQAAARQQQRGEDEVVGIDDPLQVTEARPQVVLNRRQRDIHHGDIEEQHKYRHADGDGE